MLDLETMYMHWETKIKYNVYNVTNWKSKQIANIRRCTVK